MINAPASFFINNDNNSRRIIFFISYKFFWSSFLNYCIINFIKINDIVITISVLTFMLWKKVNLITYFITLLIKLLILLCPSWPHNWTLWLLIMTKIAIYFYLFLFWTLFSIEELFCVLDSSKDYKYDYGNNKNPWIIIICFTIPFLGVRVADQCLKKQDDTKSIIDLIKMFELIWSFRTKYFIPNIYIYGQH